jgi:hypothetical protein
MPASKLSRKAIREGLDTLPIEEILGASVSKELTPKQRAFAREVAKGKTKADAYRAAYKPDATPATIGREPYMLAADPRVAKEIEAYSLALEAAKHRTPAHLRELVIQSLVSVLLDDDAKHATKVQAAKVLGTVTEVAAFTERKEVRTISTTEDAKAKVLGQLREIMQADAQDVDAIDDGAAALLAEIESAPGDPHPSPTPHGAEQESHAPIHTIPHEQSLIDPNSQPEEPTPSVQGTPPVDGTK